LRLSHASSRLFPYTPLFRSRPGDLVSCLIADPRGWRFIFTGHVAPGSAAAGLIAAGRASRHPWNVHPRARDQLWLAGITGARHLDRKSTRLNSSHVKISYAV